MRTSTLIKGAASALLLQMAIGPTAHGQNLLWEDNYGGSNNDRLRAVDSTTDGGFVYAGHTASSDGDVSSNQGGLDYWVVHVDPSGNIEWEETYGGTSEDWGEDIEQTDDGGYIVTGHSKSSDGDVSQNAGMSDFWVLKLNSSGGLQWESSFGGSSADQANVVHQTDDGGFLVGGFTESSDGDVSNYYGSRDLWLCKLDAAGNLSWERNYGGSSSDNLKEVRQMQNGEFVLAGVSSSTDQDVSSNHGNGDFWIVNTTNSGSIIWEQTYGGSQTEFLGDIRQVDAGGFIAAGKSESSDGDVSANNGSGDAWLLRIDDTGVLQWESNYGGTNADFVRTVRQTPSGDFLAFGHSASSDGDVGGNQGSDDIWIFKADDTGSLLWEENFGGSNTETGPTHAPAGGGKYLVAQVTRSSDGDVSSNQGQVDGWAFMLEDTTTTVSSVADRQGLEKGDVSLRPNPTRGLVRVDLDNAHGSVRYELMDVQGRVLESGSEEGADAFSLEVGGPAGVYFLRLRSGGSQEVLKVVKR